jgi:hypothetical protein
MNELRQRLITGLPVTDPWAINALYDHDLERFTDFTDDELQLIQQYFLNHQRDVISPLVSRLFEGDSADSENEDAEENMRDPIETDLFIGCIVLGSLRQYLITLSRRSSKSAFKQVGIHAVWNPDYGVLEARVDIKTARRLRALTLPKEEARPRKRVNLIS